MPVGWPSFGASLPLMITSLTPVTQFYDPVTLHVGESIYIDSNMGHAYVTTEGCDEALVLAACSSTDESLMESLLSLHGDSKTLPPAKR